MITAGANTATATARPHTPRPATNRTPGGCTPHTSGTAAASAGIVSLGHPSAPLRGSDVSDAAGLPILGTWGTDARLQARMKTGLLAYPRHQHFFHELDRLVGLRP